MTSTASTTKRRYSVSFSGYRHGMFSMGYETAVDAVDEESATAAARQKAAESGFAREASGRVTIVRLYRWAVTLRGRSDKRRRETYYTHARDEQRAVRQVGWMAAAQRFAGSVSNPGDERVLKVERLD